MRSIDNENDPRILRELSKLQHAEIIRLQNLLKKFETEKDEALQQKFSAEESLLILRKKIFGNHLRSQKKLKLMILIVCDQLMKLN